MAALRWPVWPSAMPVLAGMLIVLSGCGTPRPDPETLKPGTYFQITPVRYRWSMRTYLLHIPRSHPDAQPGRPGEHEQEAWPLVLVLHGAFSTADAMERQSGFSELADREGFVVAYPNGIGLFGYLQHWNAGHCCGLAEMDRVDDVGFLRYVIRDVASRVHIDPQRVYVVGHSNGAMLAYRFAAENSESTAAVGVVAGCLGSSKGAPQRGLMRWGPQGRAGAVCRIGPPKTPVPLIAIHGRDDETVPWAGGPGRHSGPRQYESVVDSVGRWARYCRCMVAPEVADDPCGGWCIMTWRDDRQEPWVVLHVLDHWKHAWPGTPVTGQLPLNHPLWMFEASQVIWDFFCCHTP
jgi:polyhydroxybutyrate depolymerase